MLDDVQYLSQDKYDELNREISKLKENTIPALAKRIDEAKQMGDLSENAEYHAAREEMAWAQSRVKEIESIISQSEIIEAKETISGVVEVGTTLKVKSGSISKEFTIVGAQEADPLRSKISNESPLGQAFLGKKAGDTVQVAVPSGVQTYKILSVL